MAQQAPATAGQPRQGQTINIDRQVCKVRFSLCGRFMAAGGYDATVRRWEVTDTAFTAMPNLTGHNGWVQALAFHPDRQRLFTADSWGALRSWAFTERQPNALRTIPAAHEGWIRDLAISADGRLLATCGRDQKVRVWSAEDGRKLQEISEHNDDVYCVAFHPDNRSLVSGDLHGNVKQWDVTTGRETRAFDCRTLYRVTGLKESGGVRCLVFNPGGTTLVCAGGRPNPNGAMPTMFLYDWSNGRLQHTLSIEEPVAGFIFDLAFHASGYIMAVTSGQPGTGRFYFHRPAEQRPFFLSTAMPNCHSIALHPAGNRLVVAATNANSNGNGRNLNNGQYPGNFSPLHVWTL